MPSNIPAWLAAALLSAAAAAATDPTPAACVEAAEAAGAGSGGATAACLESSDDCAEDDAEVQQSSVHLLQQRLRLEEGAGAGGAAAAAPARLLPRAPSGDAGLLPRVPRGEAASGEAGPKASSAAAGTLASKRSAGGRRQLARGQQSKASTGQWCGYDEQSGFIAALTKSDSDDLMLDLGETLEKESVVRFMVTAVTVAGTYYDTAGLLTPFAYPAEETPNTVYEIKSGSDGASLDVYRPEWEIRTTDPQSRKAMRRGTGSGWIGSMTTYYCSTTTPPAASEPATPEKPRAVIDGGTLVQSGFFVTSTVMYGAVSYRLLSVKAFPHNLDVVVEYMMTDGLPLALGFSLIKLREKPMTPRGVDNRLLYFTTDYTDLGLHEPQPKELPGDTVDRIQANMWRYDLSALPGEQIRIHVDPTVPERWRPYFREGVEAWNQAFALVGRPSAVRAVLPEDADWPEEYDIADARYSTISWSFTEDVVSMGIAKVDPRSGEIMKSDITMSDGWVRAWLGDLDLLSNITHQIDFSGGLRRESLTHGGTAAGHRGIRAAVTREGTAAGASGKSSLLELHRELQLELAHGQGGPGAAAKAAAGKGKWGKKASLMSLAAGTVLRPDELEALLGSGLRQVVAHETGHILGLRHNFKGSLAISYACTRDPNCTAEHGLSSSVMDYVPLNFPSLGAQGSDVHVFSPVLGAWDKLAIKYGYMNASDVGRESSAVPELLDVLTEAEAYPTCYDDDQGGEDPSCAAYDLTDDPVRYFEDYMERLVLVQRYLLNASVTPGAPFSNYGEAVSLVLNLAYSNAIDAVNWLGGVSNSYAVRKMSGTQPAARQPMPVEVQRRALQLLLRALRLEESGLLPPPEAFPFLVAGTRDKISTLNLDYYVRAITAGLLDRALAPSRVAQMHAQTSLSPLGAGLACGEYLAVLVAGVMDKGLVASPSYAWDVQRVLVEKLGALYSDAGSSEGSVPDEVGALVLYHLRRIHGEVESALRQVEAAQAEAALLQLDTGGGAANATAANSQMLRMHLLSMRQRVAVAVCPGNAGQPCPLNSAAAPHTSSHVGFLAVLTTFSAAFAAF